MVVKSSIYSATWGRAVRLFRRVRAELKRRPDSEHEMTINRFVLSGISSPTWPSQVFWGVRTRQ